MTGLLVLVLLPPGASADELLEKAPAGSRTRVYPAATDPAHLLSLVRSSRDPIATRWLPGMITAIAAGAGLGLATNVILAVGFEMFGGLLAIALPLGLFVGAFLGGLTAAMTGTHVANDDVKQLVRHTAAGSVLLLVEAPTAGGLDPLVVACRARDLPHRTRGATPTPR